MRAHDLIMTLPPLSATITIRVAFGKSLPTVFNGCANACASLFRMTSLSRHRFRTDGKPRRCEQVHSALHLPSLLIQRFRASIYVNLSDLISFPHQICAVQRMKLPILYHFTDREDAPAAVPI